MWFHRHNRMEIKTHFKHTFAFELLHGTDECTSSRHASVWVVWDTSLQESQITYDYMTPARVLSFTASDVSCGNMWLLTEAYCKCQLAFMDDDKAAGVMLNSARGLSNLLRD